MNNLENDILNIFTIKKMKELTHLPKLNKTCVYIDTHVYIHTGVYTAFMYTHICTHHIYAHMYMHI